MGATKPNDYTELQKKIALGARALNHPCRVKIFAIIQANPTICSESIEKIIGLSKTCIREHLQKLQDAQFIHMEYNRHRYLLTVNTHYYTQFCKNIDALPEML